MEHGLFSDIVAILSVSALSLYVCNRLGIPTIVGFLLAGVLAGPRGFALVNAAGDVETLAEIGVILLLFTIGIEFSLGSLLRIKKLFLLGGTIQLSGTFCAVAILAILLGSQPIDAMLVGLLASLSSTAIVLKLLQKRAEVDTLHGRLTLGILVYQDLAIVPMLLAVPLLAGTATLDTTSLAPFLLKALGILAVIVLSVKWLLPELLYQIVRTRDPEVFQISVVVLGFGIAYLTYQIGLSLAMGAFLAGLIISESPYAQRALGNLMPLRDLFMSFFFVSVGMLFDYQIVLNHPVLILLGTALLISLKAIIAITAGLFVGLPLRASVISGIALAQIGEFSFILAEAGREQGLLDGGQFQQFLGASILSMVTTPFLIQAGPRVAELLLQLPIPHSLKVGTLSAEQQPSICDHLVISGFGLVGRHLAEAAESTDIPYAVIEANPDTVREERAKGRPVYHGDATQEAALEHVRISAARIAVVAISDPAGTKRVVERIRELNRTIHIIARTRYLAEAQELVKLGADEVIPEDYETSIEIFTRVLYKYLTPKEQITEFATKVRESGYEMLRSSSLGHGKSTKLDLMFSDFEVRVLRVQEGAGALGRSLAELNLRKEYGIMVLAIRRGEQKTALPDGDDHFEVGDNVVLLGLPELLLFAENIFKGPQETKES